MTFSLLIVVVLLTLFNDSRVGAEADETYGLLYRWGTEAYLDNNWAKCVEFIEKCLQEYARCRNVIISCRRKCRADVRTSTDDDEEDDLEQALESTVHSALCLLRCERDGKVSSISRDRQAEQDIIDKVPYDYLQLCYFKLGDVQKAASSAYTFLQHNPEHDVMKHNLKYYLGLPGVNQSEVKYLELQDYQTLYLSAGKAYASGDNEKVVSFMEQALMAYFIAETDCRLLCQSSLTAPAFTSLMVTIANHYTFTLRCKLRCPSQLSSFYGERTHDLVTSILHHLQFAYYKVGMLEKACQAVSSYLLLNENDPVMLENRNFYLGQKESKTEWFTPRNDVVLYHKRYMKMMKTLKFIDEAFNFTMDPLSAEKHPTRSPRIGPKPRSIDAAIKITMGEAELGAKQRFVADGLSSQQQCHKLMQLAESGATLGDGYNGSHSPHTEFESFEGLTIGRAITLLQSGSLSALDVTTLLNVSDTALHFVESTFNLTLDLYFAYTHLVCRTARPDLAESRSESDLSHPVHADNCLLTPGGQCLKQRPAYVWRDYSAILYLNDDFEGGQFFFSQPKEEEVAPRCGRLVAFSAGHENLHGVRAVKKGRRCALAMWYTLDPKHQEKERHIAAQAASEMIQEKTHHDHTDL